MKNFISKINSSPAAVLGITFIVLAIFLQFFFSDKMLFSSDQMNGFDSKVFLNESIKTHHQFPFWFSSRLSGMPSIDAMFGDAFYPPSLIVGLLASVPKAIGYKMILHVFLAGLFFFLLLRKGFKLPPWISFAGALFYMLNPQFFSHIYPGHDGKMYVIAWIPYIIWRLKTLHETPSLLNSALLSIGVTMCLLTSHVQMTYFVLWGVLAYAIFAAVHIYLKEKSIKKVFAFSGFFSLSIILALSIGLMSLYPSYMYVKDSFSVRGVDKGFEYAASWSMHWPEVFSLIVPEFVNSLDYYWGQNPFKLNSEYAGAMVLLLAILAIVSKPKSWRIFWGSVALFSILYSLGGHSFLFQIAYYIVPGVKKFRAASMFMFWFSFSVSILASLFLKDIFTKYFSEMKTEAKKKWTRGLLIAVGVLFGFTLLLSSKGIVSGIVQSMITDTNKANVFDANFSRNFTPMLWLWFALSGTTLILLYFLILEKIKPQTFIAIVLLLSIFDVLRIDFKFIKLISPAPYFYSEPAITDLANKMRSEPFRCYSLPGALPQNGEGIHNLEGVSGFHDNELHWYREFRGDQQDQDFLYSLIQYDNNGQPYLNSEKLSEGNPFLNIANAKYLLVRSQGQLLAIPNRNAFDRISFACKYLIMDSVNTLNSLKTESYDYRHTVALYEKPDFASSDSGDYAGTVTTKWNKYSPNYSNISVNAPCNGLLRISEVYYPGREIYIDGKKVKSLRADFTWTAISIPKGEHVIEIFNRSLYFGKISWLSFGVATLLLIYFAVQITFRYTKKKT
jgi:hypothetical protein